MGEKLKNTNQGHRRATLAALAALTLGFPFASALAQDTSDKPIRMILPNSAGSSVDALARALATPLGKALGHAIVVENLPGAGGVTGTLQVVRAQKDGMTIGLVSNNHVVNPSVYKSMPFDSIKDITAISVVATSPFVLVAHPSVPATNVRELVALARAHPGQLNYGSSGNGTILQLSAEAFKAEAGGLDIKHVPYKGVGQLTSDLLGDHVQLAFLGVTGVAPLIKAGKLKAIGMSSVQRSALLPDVPTIAEQGLGQYNMDGWIALIGPAGLPAPVVAKLSAALKSALSGKEMQDALAMQGMTAVGSSTASTTQLFQTDMKRYAKLIKDSGTMVD
jgi:tripartite-type tricarboxylate transporter receptor subunit TctC